MGTVANVVCIEHQVCPGTEISTFANARTLQARKGVGKAFITAFSSGAVMGFLLDANGLLVLFIYINVFKLFYGDDREAGASEHARTFGPKGSDCHEAAVIGNTIGDPLKDTLDPSLNILINLMTVESLVFEPFFATHGGLLFKIF
ncbi:hypothetical protein HPP92_016472 [Vanilla planifolia]|uniref:H(+)-exporting diphosphatase n=1 Tax=Vanilla planifolia TaxID=51239 RepID=A0A835QF55_VANPL|nr:hypothetical protein HPP92_017008 [Vanilla planifolia]KAG0471926.1 hypothetical protein HPP92_016472 [Vanilla planifolia]